MDRLTVATERFRVYLRDVRFKDYTFEVTRRGDCIYLQASFLDLCTVQDICERQFTRQWMLHPDMTRNEVVQTAFKCVLTSVEHEAREAFKYRGHAIMGPHFDVDALVGICIDKKLDYRKAA